MATSALSNRRKTVKTGATMQSFATCRLGSVVRTLAPDSPVRPPVGLCCCGSACRCVPEPQLFELARKLVGGHQVFSAQIRVSTAHHSKVGVVHA